MLAAAWNHRGRTNVKLAIREPCFSQEGVTNFNSEHAFGRERDAARFSRASCFRLCGHPHRMDQRPTDECRDRPPARRQDGSPKTAPSVAAAVLNNTKVPPLKRLKRYFMDLIKFYGQ